MIDHRRTWITAEWLTAVGGAERVVKHLADMMPSAGVFTPLLHEQGAPGVDDIRIKALVSPRSAVRQQLGVVLNVATWREWGRRIDRRVNLVVASHHLASQWSAAYSDVPHAAYVHTPARYAWFPEVDGRGSGLGAQVLCAHIRRMDRRAARRVVSYAANSRTTQQRIREVWDRDAVVIPPPVDVARFRELSPRSAQPFLLGVSRFVDYKRLDHVIDVGEAAGLPVRIVGGGPLEAQLRRRAEDATVPVEVLTGLDDREVAQQMVDAAALVYPALEDFGIVPVEAMAAGTPVLALNAGGTAETVVDGVTGLLFPDLDAATWAAQLGRALAIDPATCRARAEQFSPEAFRASVSRWVDDARIGREGVREVDPWGGIGCVGA